MDTHERFEDRVAASYRPLNAVAPFISIVIPHYKRRRYLEIVLHSLFEQTYDDFEIIVSDDCSPDDSNQVIPALLQQSGRTFRYYTQATNLGYDGNVRFCLAAAQGRYVMLLGNDDALGGPTTLAQIAAQLEQLDYPEVAFTSYADWSSGMVTKRAQQTRLLGSGPETALRFFRSFSFVSGLIFDQAATRKHETDRWDQSVFYQIYLGSRIVASGDRLAALDVCGVRKDVTIQGDVPNSYASKWANPGWSFQPRHTGLDAVIRVAVDGVIPLLPAAQRSSGIRQIISQVFTINYSFWLFEYRRVANWSFATGIARSMWPGKLLPEYQLRWRDKAILWLLYFGTTTIGLLLPNKLFHRFKQNLANFIRHRQQSTSSLAGSRLA